MMNTALYCNDCKVNRIVAKGYYTCPKCSVIISLSIIEANGCTKDCENVLIAGILTLL